MDRNEIIDGLDQGGYPAPTDSFEYDIVVNAAGSQRYTYPELPRDVVYIELDLHDSSDFRDTAQHRVRTTANLLAGAINSGRRVLVHCLQGWNRSGLVVARTLIELGWRPERAIEVVQERRHPMALSNPIFTAWLMREGVSLQNDLANIETQFDIGGEG